MSKLNDLPGRVGAVIDKHIRPMFVPSAKLKATLLIRFADDPEGRCDVLVTDDNDAGIRAIVARRLAPIAVAPADAALSHTAEPWRAGGGTGGNGSIVADEPVHDMVGSDSFEYYGGHLIAESMVPRNIRRAVACVNACRGVPTEVLEANAAGGLPWNVGDQIDQRVQRTQLLEALEEARTGLLWYQDRNPGQADGSDDEAMARINAAIEAAGGSAS